MSGIQRIWSYCRENPVALYLGGGVLLHTLRTATVNRCYTQYFARNDVERKLELEEFLSTHPKPQEQ